MKKALILFILPIFLSAQADFEVVKDSKWLTNYDKAINKAQKESKNVLVYFTGSDWCPPCKMLKTDLFDSAEFKALSEEYVLLYVDMPRNRDLLSNEQMTHNKQVMGKYNKKGTKWAMRSAGRTVADSAMRWNSPASRPSRSTAVIR